MIKNIIKNNKKNKQPIANFRMFTLLKIKQPKSRCSIGVPIETELCKALKTLTKT